MNFKVKKQPDSSPAWFLEMMTLRGYTFLLLAVTPRFARNSFLPGCFYQAFLIYSSYLNLIDPPTPYYLFHFRQVTVFLG